jgi:AcrR family transcriptional regulator
MAGRRERGEPTREALIRAAEKLMAEQGIDGVDLKEVQLAAGSLNRSAVNYHFGTRDGLAEAVAARHRKEVNEARLRLLNRLEHSGKLNPRTLVDALLLPVAKELKTESGRNYIVIASEIITPFYRWPEFLAGPRPHFDGVRRWVDLVLPRLPGSFEDKRLRVGHTVMVLNHMLVDIARDLNAGNITYRQAQYRVRHVRDYMTKGLCGDIPETFPAEPD